MSVPQVVNDPISQAIALLQQAGLDVTEQVGPPFATHATTTDPPAGGGCGPARRSRSTWPEAATAGPAALRP